MGQTSHGEKMNENVDLCKLMLVDGFKKSGQLVLVQPAVCPDAAADIESERTHFLHRLMHIVGVQAAGQKNRNSDGFANPAADAPIVLASGSAQLLDGKFLIP